MFYFISNQLMVKNQHNSVYILFEGCSNVGWTVSVVVSLHLIKHSSTSFALT